MLAEKWCIYFQLKKYDPPYGGHFEFLAKKGSPHHFQNGAPFQIFLKHHSLRVCKVSHFYHNIVVWYCFYTHSPPTIWDLFVIKKIKKHVDYDELRRSLNMLDMSQRRILHGLCLLFKVLNDLGPVYLRDLFTLHEEISLRETRTSNRNIYLPNSNTSAIHIKSFKNYVARVWNKLPNDTKSCKTLYTLKKKS